MKISKYIGLALCCGMFASCEMKETPVPLPPAGEAENAEVNMGSNYASQIFFDLETGKAVSQNLKADWDLGFEADAEGFHIVMNTGKSMFSYNAGTNNFETADTAGKMAVKLYDVPSGNLDSTAIGDWRTAKNVYFIDRGYDASANHIGYKKIQFLNVDAHSFEFKMSDLNGDNLVQKKIDKDSNYNFVFLSMTTGNTAKVEPPKKDWDIVFTQYTYIFFEPEFMPYLVTGCLLNRYNTTGAKDSLVTFASIDLAKAEETTLSKSIDVIGYDWKTFNGTKYSVNSAMNYVIKNRHGNYYKLHFLDFYSPTGEKGNPVFEFQKL